MIYYDPVVVERYARALFQAAKKANATQDVVANIEVLAPLVSLGGRLKIFFDAPQIPTERKAELIERAFKGRVHPLFYHFLLLLLRKGRIDLSRPIFQRFVKLVERDMGILQAEVATARPLDEAERARLKAALERFTKAKLHIKFTADPRLIAGVRFTCEDLLIDDTVAGKLSRLRGRLEAVVNA
ncbi:MAG: ATP synthase F1 subunit delta [Candidatus Sumerlaeaceae bacterium]|nr:ATP synthase F1 subunit delta [Candidatus Sumerlaeaceae bacterium]